MSSAAFTSMFTSSLNWVLDATSSATILAAFRRPPLDMVSKIWKARRAFYLLGCFFGLPTVIASSSAPLEASGGSADRGYQPRACGFDTDHDGNPGEPEDCSLCNGRWDASDPMVDEIYVSCSEGPFPAGADDASCGDPLTPCATLTAALELADGPAVDGPDVICFRNRCREENLSFKPHHGGASGLVAAALPKADGTPWWLPEQPAMIVGWDQDADGVYPPVDEDDEAVLLPPETCPGSINQACDDGSPYGSILNPEDDTQRFYQKPLERAFYLAEQVHHVELAHFEVWDYGRFTLTDNSGFLDFAADSPSAENHYIYFHDIEARGLNLNSNFTSRTSAINMFKWFQDYVTFENMLFDGNGHWFARGGDNAGPDRGPVRWQNLTVRQDPCRPRPEASCDPGLDPQCPSGFVCLDPEAGDPAGCEPAAGEACVTRASTAFKVWGYYTDFEILSSVLDSGWSSQTSLDVAGVPRGIDVAQCLQGWVIRNNEIIDFNSPIELTPDSAFCGSTSRPIDRIVIDGNLIRHPTPGRIFDHGIHLEPGGADYPGQHIRNVLITNNMISSVAGLESCIIVDTGSEHVEAGLDDIPGTVEVIHNTCWGPITQGAGLLIGSPAGPAAVLQHDIVVRNNIFFGLDDDSPNIATAYAPERFVVSHNLWDPSAGFRWDQPTGYDITYDPWAAATGDHGAVGCTPQLAYPDGFLSTGDAAPLNGDLHLSPTDACARDRGMALAGEDLPGDIDGDDRMADLAPDLGADELAYDPSGDDPPGDDPSEGGPPNGGPPDEDPPDDDPLAVDLVAHWPLDELIHDNGECWSEDSSGSGLRAVVGNGCSAGPVVMPDAVVGAGLDLNGFNDYLRVADDPRLDLTSSFTLSAWIRPDTFGDQGYGRILAKQKYVGGFGPGYSFYVANVPEGSPPGLRALCANIDVYDIGCSRADVLYTPIGSDPWRHVALVFDDSADEARFYVDGLPAGEFAADGRPRASNVPLMLGDRDDLSRSFDGGLDDVRVWSRALSDEEIRLAGAVERPMALAVEGSASGSLGLFPEATQAVTVPILSGASADCRMAPSPGPLEDPTPFEDMVDTLAPDASGGRHQATVTIEGNGFYELLVSCRDRNGVMLEGSITVTFYVGFHPSQPESTEFFIESRVGLDHMSLATGRLSGSYSQIPNYCDMDLFPEGCVRRWTDLSGTVSARPSEVPVGRDFGQDDVEKPFFVSDCLNGLPCARTLDVSSFGHMVQAQAFEVENVDDLDPIIGAFSVYLLVRPQGKGEDFALFGFVGDVLRVRAADGSLEMTLNGSPVATTVPGAVTLGQWHLIEAHRVGSQVRLRVNGSDLTDTASPSTAPSSHAFDFHFLLSDTRGEAMWGDLAATAIYDGELTEQHKARIRGYFETVYAVGEMPEP